MEIFDDLEAEQDRLEAILAGLGEKDWVAPSGAVGWTVADVVLHLAQTDETVVTSAEGTQAPDRWIDQDGGVDDVVDRLVQAERGDPTVVFGRWRAARRAAMKALRQADPDRPLPWVGPALKPRTLATTRLAEHWAHGLDITGPLGIPLPDTDRLWHIARLGHRSLPYAFAVADEPAGPVFCQLTAPDGATWRFGPPEAESTITGPAAAFCRVGARRLPPERSGLVASGPYGPGALRVLRNYAA